MSRTSVTVRPAEPSDLEAIMRIDEKLTGSRMGQDRAVWGTRL